MFRFAMWVVNFFEIVAMGFSFIVGLLLACLTSPITALEVRRRAKKEAVRRNKKSLEMANKYHWAYQPCRWEDIAYSSEEELIGFWMMVAYVPVCWLAPRFSYGLFRDTAQAVQNRVAV